jgi:RNA polymerase sigma-70 factor (ECF subfamily)
VAADDESFEKWNKFEPDQTWDRLRQVAFDVARKITGRREDAKDIAQATLAAYGLTRHVIENPEAWVSSVARRSSYNFMRRARRLTLTEPTNMHEGRVDRSEEKADEVDLIVGMIVYEDLLTLLSPKQRATLELRYGADLERAQIAEILQITEETVKIHLKRGVKRLRQAVGAGNGASRWQSRDRT